MYKLHARISIYKNPTTINWQHTILHQSISGSRIICNQEVNFGMFVIDQIDPRGPRKDHASHRTTHSAWVRGWMFVHTNLVPRACDPWEGNEGSGISGKYLVLQGYSGSVYIILFRIITVRYNCVGMPLNFHYPTYPTLQRL
jgi:hypothetical protein